MPNFHLITPCLAYFGEYDVAAPKLFHHYSFPPSNQDLNVRNYFLSNTIKFIETSNLVILSSYIL